MPETAGPVRLAILGTGAIGGVHALAAREAPEATVTAVWSRTPSHARDLAERAGATPCDTIEIGRASWRGRV